MSEKRRDNKGRILKTGESQRKDLTYQYRYNDIDGKRKTVYAPTLNELREKEKDVQKHLELGVSITKSNISLRDLLEEYLSIKRNVKETTMGAYTTILNVLSKEPFTQNSVGKIKPIDAKRWLIDLHERGYSFCTIKNFHSFLKSAYLMAIENEYTAKNPFAFKLDFIKNKNPKRSALTESQQETFLSFLKGSEVYSKYYDVCVFLLETGIRVGELCGLTMKDIDFDRQSVSIGRQVVRTKEHVCKVTDPKTQAGIRTIPLTPKAMVALKNMIRDRPKSKVEVVIDGISHFILISERGNPYYSSRVDDIFKGIRKEYVKEGIPLPKITPHILRHTFCTNMVNRGVIPKHLQYLMGHNDISITMNVYTSIEQEQVFLSMKKLSLID